MTTPRSNPSAWVGHQHAFGANRPRCYTRARSGVRHLVVAADRPSRLATTMAGGRHVLTSRSRTSQGTRPGQDLPAGTALAQQTTGIDGTSFLSACQYRMAHRL